MNFAGFDQAIATGAAPSGSDAMTGELQGTFGLQPAPVRSAFQVGVDSGVPTGIARSYLLELGLDEDATPELLLDFDPEDLVAARRAFMAEEGSAPTALHRAQVTAWMRVLAGVIGPRAPSLLDAEFRAPRAPPQLALTAPGAAAPETALHSHERSGPHTELSLPLGAGLPAFQTRLLEQHTKAAAPAPSPLALALAGAVAPAVAAWVTSWTRATQASSQP